MKNKETYISGLERDANSLSYGLASDLLTPKERAEIEKKLIRTLELLEKAKAEKP